MNSNDLDYFNIIHQTIAAGTDLVKYYIQLAGSEGKSL